MGRLAAVAALGVALTMGMPAAAQDSAHDQRNQNVSRYDKADYKKSEYKKDDRDPDLLTVDGLAFLAGQWAVHMDGGIMDEYFSKPKNGVVSGMFRYNWDGKVASYGVMSIAEDDEGVVFRMTELGAELEAPERPYIYKRRLLEVGEGRAVFDGITFEMTDPATMTVTVSVRNKKGEDVRTMTMTYERVCQGFCVMP